MPLQFPGFSIALAGSMAQDLRYTWIMEVPRDHQSLLSEKQAATRLGVARITLLRAREAGRIRFFRNGTRVLYSEDQLAEFLKSCERNGGKRYDGPLSGAMRKPARRKNNQASSPKQKLTGAQEKASLNACNETIDAAQLSLPFLTTR